MAEPFSIKIFDNSGNAITGGAASTTLRLMRESDGYYYDHDDATFKASGWTTLTTALTEVDATNDPGHYSLSIDVSGWTEGRYQADIRYSGTPKRAGYRDFYVSGGVAY